MVLSSQAFESELDLVADHSSTLAIDKLFERSAARGLIVRVPALHHHLRPPPGVATAGMETSALGRVIVPPLWDAELLKGLRSASRCCGSDGNGGSAAVWESSERLSADLREALERAQVDGKGIASFDPAKAKILRD